MVSSRHFYCLWAFRLIVLPRAMAFFKGVVKRKLRRADIISKFFSSVSDGTVEYIFPMYYNDVYTVALPSNHRFPMNKYQLVRSKVQQNIASMNEGQIKNVTADFRISPLASYDEITTTHCPIYLSRYIRGELSESEIRNIGFPWSMDGVNRSLSSVGGTVSAACSTCLAKMAYRKVNTSTHLESKSRLFWAAHMAGGTHHAFYDRGEGFCVFSDIAVAANVVRSRYPEIAKRILIIDLDVHQGNGNAVLFKDRDDVFTFSIHCTSNYFSKKEESSLDVELPAGCDDVTYLSTLKYWLKRLLFEAGNFDMIFYQGGVDVLGGDRLGRMNLTQEGVRRRNMMVYRFADQMDAMLIITMGGGYPASNDWDPIISAHAGVYLDAYSYLCNR